MFSNLERFSRALATRRTSRSSKAIASYNAFTDRTSARRCQIGPDATALPTLAVTQSGHVLRGPSVPQPRRYKTAPLYHCCTAAQCGPECAGRLRPGRAGQGLVPAHPTAPVATTQTPRASDHLCIRPVLPRTRTCASWWFRRVPWPKLGARSPAWKRMKPQGLHGV